MFEHELVILVSTVLGWVSSRLGTRPLSFKNSQLSELDRLEHKQIIERAFSARFCLDVRGDSELTHSGRKL